MTNLTRYGRVLAACALLAAPVVLVLLALVVLLLFVVLPVVFALLVLLRLVVEAAVLPVNLAMAALSVSEETFNTSLAEAPSQNSN